MVDFFNICQKIGRHLDMLLRLGGRGRAEIGIFFIAEAGAGAGPGLQFCLLPGLGSFFFISGAAAGPGSKILK